MNDWVYFKIYWDDDYLSSKEIEDVEASLKEIKEGKAQKFENVEDFLKELKK